MENNPERPLIQELVKKLPEKPGVYQFLDQTGTFIYVGKAKNLKKRVSSYFTRSDQHSYKHDAMVRKIHDIHYVLVEDESDALLLENNLIKEYQPRYNILLKDDKTYPWIVITEENFPKVMLTRNQLNDGSVYFGPYTSVVMARSMLDLIRQLFKLRTCKLNLSPENIEKGKLKRCLEYDLGNCKAPCEGLQKESEYMEHIQQIKDILKGNFQQVILELKHLMHDYAREYQFEKAEYIRIKIETLEKYKGKSTIVSQSIHNIDVFSLLNEENYAYVNFMKIVHGAIVQSHNLEVVKRMDESQEEILEYVVFALRDRFSSNAQEILVPFIPGGTFKEVHFVIPQRGEKRKLLELSARNAASYKRDREMTRALARKEESEDSVLVQLKKDLRLKTLPNRIECFDNSNIQGTHPVASCVVFVSGKPKKSEYRHFNIKSVKGPNDFASMEEIIERRYTRLLQEGGNLPDLVIVDGGKGQLSAALKSLDKLALRGKLPIIGIAKRLEEIIIPGDPVPLYLDKNSRSLRLIQNMRDEAHRFGIAFHRKKRESDFLDSVLDKIPGVGEKTREKLLIRFKEVDTIRSVSMETLVNFCGKKTGELIYRYFHPA